MAQIVAEVFTPMSFRYIRRNRNSGSLRLRSKSVYFAPGKSLRQDITTCNPIHRFLPDQQITIAFNQYLVVNTCFKRGAWQPLFSPGTYNLTPETFVSTSDSSP